MKDFRKIKKKLYEVCLLYVDERCSTITTMIESTKNDLYSETKSSAGDKHETGRAMLQLEIEKASIQLDSVNEMKGVLDKISIEKTSKISSLGSLITTTKATYYLAISAGKFTIDSNDYYAVSTNSPIGKQLLGKSVGEYIPFNQSEMVSIY